MENVAAFVAIVAVFEYRRVFLLLGEEFSALLLGPYTAVSSSFQSFRFPRTLSTSAANASRNSRHLNLEYDTKLLKTLHHSTFEVEIASCCMQL